MAGGDQKDPEGDDPGDDPRLEVADRVVVAPQLEADDPIGDLETRTVPGTVALGLLLVPAGRVALWLFGRGSPV